MSVMTSTLTSTLPTLPSDGTSLGLPQIDPEGGSSVSISSGITKEIISRRDSGTEPAPFLPKVRGALHLQLIGSWKPQEKIQWKEKQALPKMMAWNYELSPETTAGIVEIFAKSVEQRTTVDKMWSELKANALKRLNPIIRHSHRLNCKASPSTKQCLEIYKKPTAIDRYTGKPIPLGQVLNEVTKRMYTSRGTMSAINVAMSQVARLTQMRAEMLLEKKDPYNPGITSVHQDWYFVPQQERAPKSSGISSSSRPRTRTADRKRRSLRVRRIDGGTNKKQLPSYLTSNGCVLSASLEEFDGEVIYCTPSQRSKSVQQEEDEPDTIHRDNSSSIFMTDIVCPQSAQSEKHTVMGTSLIPASAVERMSSSAPRSSSRAVSRETAATTRATTGTTRVTTCTSRLTTDKSTPSSGVRVIAWEPLNTTALLEHTTVSEIPLRGLGPLAHGRYHMWRPESCHTHTHVIENSSE